MMRYALCVLGVLTSTVGCQSVIHHDARRLSVLAEADGTKPDGTPWDNGGGDVIPVWGPFMLPSVFSTSPYPDLVLSVVTSDGDVQEYSNGINQYGTLDSVCENRLPCRWEIDVPSASYAVLITDVDPTLNPNMTWEGVKTALSGAGDSSRLGEAPLATSRQFISGALFPAAGGSSEDELATLELVTRNWLASVATDLVPTISLPRHPRDGCREHKCLSDADGISGSLAMTALDAPARQGQTRGFGNVLSALKPRASRSQNSAQ